jgi:hypothetical protein
LLLAVAAFVYLGGYNVATHAPHTAREIVPPSDLARSELSRGLYPKAPELARKSGFSPAEQFWIIKHGIKLTAMPAWGKTHSDPLNWNMVAFVRQLPGTSAEEYRRLFASAPEGHDAMMQGMQDRQGGRGLHE